MKKSRILTKQVPVQTALFVFIALFSFSSQAFAEKLPWADNYGWHTTLDQTARTLTYSFDYVGGERIEDADPESSGITRSMNEISKYVPDWKERIRAKLDRIGAATGITYVEVPDSGAFDQDGAQGIIRFKSLIPDVMNGVCAYGYYPPQLGDTEETTAGSSVGDIFISSYLDSWAGGDEWGNIIAHELGHSLALDHPVHIQDAYPSTVMSYYNPSPDGPTDLDVSYLQALYLPDDDSPVYQGNVLDTNTTRIKLSPGTENERRELTVQANISSDTDRTPGIKGDGTYLPYMDYGFTYSDVSISKTGQISTEGSFSQGIIGSGHNNIQLDGKILSSGLYGDGMYFYGNNNTIHVGATGAIITQGIYASGIALRGFVNYKDKIVYGQTNSITMEGNIATQGWGSEGIYLQNQYYLNVDVSGAITTAGTYSHGISMYDTVVSTFDFSNAINMSGTITTQGDKSCGIHLSKPQFQNTVNMSGAITTHGNISHGIGLTDTNAQNTVNIAGGGITTHGENSHGVYLYNVGAGLTLLQKGSITTNDASSYGFALYSENVQIYHSGITTVPDGSYAIYYELEEESDIEGIQPLELHLLSGTTINGNINNTTSHAASIFMGNLYGDNQEITGTDATFTFTYTDQIQGLWDYNLEAGTFNYTGFTLENTNTFKNNGNFVGDMLNTGLVKGNGAFTGTFENNGSVAPGLSIGTLTFNGDYTQGPDGTLEIEVDRTSNDMVVVTGTANMAGTVTFVPLGYVPTASRAFLDAGVLVDSGWSVAPEDYAVFDLDIVFTAQGASLSITRHSYQSLVNRSIAGFAAALDTTRPSADGDMESILNSVDTMSLPALQRSIADLSPQFYNSISTAVFGLERMKANALMQQINAHPLQDGFTPWVTFITEHDNYKTTMESSAFTTTQFGFIGGVEQKASKSLHLGAAISSGTMSVDEKLRASEADARFWELYAYGSWAPQILPEISLKTVLGAGQVYVDTARDITFLSRTATSDYCVETYTALINAEYTYAIDQWKIAPHLGLEYYLTNAQSIEEHGAHAANMRINTKMTDSAISNLGTKLGRSFTIGQTNFGVSVGANWLHDFLYQESSLSGRLSTGQAFSIAGRDRSKDFFETNVGVSIDILPQLSGNAMYQYTFGDHLKSSSQYSFQLKLTF